MKKSLLSMLAGGLTLLGAAAGAQAADFIAILSGGEEVPANASKARGIAVFTLSEDGSTFHYKLIVANIQNVVAAHVHTGAVGVNGPVVQDLYRGTPGGGRFSGILAEGSFPATEALLEAMESGGTYVNVHTNDGVPPTNTGPGDLAPGEIRGQVEPIGFDEDLE
jgi:CHRD domain